MLRNIVVCCSGLQLLGGDDAGSGAGIVGGGGGAEGGAVDRGEGSGPQGLSRASMDELQIRWGRRCSRWWRCSPRA